MEDNDPCDLGIRGDERHCLGILGGLRLIRDPKIHCPDYNCDLHSCLLPIES